MSIDVINLADKFSRFDERWHPFIVAELNGQQVKLAKLEGGFVWHSHAEEDEMFFVIDGRLTIELRDGEVELTSGDVCGAARCRTSSCRSWSRLRTAVRAGDDAAYGGRRERPSGRDPGWI